MIKKLCKYALSCVIESQKSENIINLKRNKWAYSDDKKGIKELETLYKLNKINTRLYCCSKYFINDAPVFYCEAEAGTEKNINIGLLIPHFENMELLEEFLKQIEETKEEKEIINILINEFNFDKNLITEKTKNICILANIQESKTGIIKELQEIIKKC